MGDKSLALIQSGLGAVGNASGWSWVLPPTWHGPCFPQRKFCCVGQPGGSQRNLSGLLGALNQLIKGGTWSCPHPGLPKTCSSTVPQRRLCHLMGFLGDTCSPAVVCHLNPPVDALISLLWLWRPGWLAQAQAFILKILRLHTQIPSACDIAAGDTMSCVPGEQGPACSTASASITPGSRGWFSTPLLAAMKTILAFLVAGLNAMAVMGQQLCIVCTQLA